MMLPFGKSRKGSSLIEFTFVGIPLIFILISIFEMARGMWIYNTQAHAVKEGTRYAIVHGAGFNSACLAAGNAASVCTLKVSDIAGAICGTNTVTAAGICPAGMVPGDVTVTIKTNSATLASEKLSVALTDGTTASNGNLAAGMPIEIDATYNFASALAMFWPGAGPGITFNGGSPIQLPASSQDLIQF